VVLRNKISDDENDPRIVNRTMQLLEELMLRNSGKFEESINPSHPIAAPPLLDFMKLTPMNKRAGLSRFAEKKRHLD
jgi:hypothetical protein